MLRKALESHLGHWVTRPPWWPLTFRVTQVLTGHKCFGKYLYRIGRAVTPAYAHCDAAVDFPQHTLAVCPAWAAERRTFCSVVGKDCSLESVFPCSPTKPTGRTVVSFCERVMLAKEATGRERERTDNPVRRWIVVEAAGAAVRRR